jgi:hypothetical protein
MSARSLKPVLQVKIRAVRFSKLIMQVKIIAVRLSKPDMQVELGQSGQSGYPS